MTTWTDQTGTSASYILPSPESETIWDSGNTAWDVLGNVESTQWDVSRTSYTTLTGNSQTWTEV